MDEEFVCKACHKQQGNDSIGGELKAGLVCNECFLDSLKKIIQDVQTFVCSSDFKDKGKVIDKRVWLSKEMGKWSSETKSGYYELSLLQNQEALQGEHQDMKTVLSIGLGLEEDGF